MAMQQQYDDDHTRHSKKRSRLIIDIVPELRRRIKVAAAQNDLSVQEYVGRILDQAVPPEVNPGQRQYNHSIVQRLTNCYDSVRRSYVLIQGKCLKIP